MHVPVQGEIVKNFLNFFMYSSNVFHEPLKSNCPQKQNIKTPKSNILQTSYSLTSGLTKPCI